MLKYKIKCQIDSTCGKLLKRRLFKDIIWVSQSCTRSSSQIILSQIWSTRFLQSFWQYFGGGDTFLGAGRIFWGLERIFSEIQLKILFEHRKTRQLKAEATNASRKIATFSSAHQENANSNRLECCVEFYLVKIIQKINPKCLPWSWKRVTFSSPDQDDANLNWHERRAEIHLVRLKSMTGYC